MARDGRYRFYFAVDRDFPAALLPPGEGLIVADRFAGEIVREAPLRPLNAARRKAMPLRFARLAASRLHALSDRPPEQPPGPREEQGKYTP